MVDTSITQDEKKCSQSLSLGTRVVVTPANLQKEAEVQHLLLDLFLSTCQKQCVNQEKKKFEFVKHSIDYRSRQ